MGAATRERGGEKPFITKHVADELARAERRILLVEDNPVNREVATVMLRKSGLTVDVAVNGLEAIRALAKAPYELVLMDCQMPELDGFEATRRIRSLGAKTLNPKIPIIAMTANAMQGDMQACLDAGMDDYIAKPIRSSELMEKVDRWLVGCPLPDGRRKNAVPPPRSNEIHGDQRTAPVPPAGNDDSRTVTLGHMSHKLRTPLNAILGFSEVLQEGHFGELNEKQRQYVKDIHDSGAQLLSIVDDIQALGVKVFTT
jgi:CheY-like chemotaxis protein